MALDLASAVLIIDIVAKGLGVAAELQKLAERVKSGDKVTPEEVEEFLRENEEALKKWINVPVDPPRPLGGFHEIA